MLKTVAVAAGLVGVNAQDPQRPAISGDFTAFADLTMFDFQSGRVLTGKGTWYSDDGPEDAGKFRFSDHMEFTGDGDETFSSHYVIRCDQTPQMRYRSYHRENDPVRRCDKREMTAEECMRTAWDYVANATYAGKRRFGFNEADLWDYVPPRGDNHRHNKMELAVYSMNPNVPIYTAANNRSSGNIYMHHWSNFIPGEVEDRHFEIPRSCSEPPAPSPPNVPGDFTANSELTIFDFQNGRTVTGTGRWVSDDGPEDAGKMRFADHMEFTDPRDRVYSSHLVVRCDQTPQMRYRSWHEQGNETRTCEKRELTAEECQQTAWDWVKDATYQGRRNFGYSSADVWDYRPARGVRRNHMELAVYAMNNNVPIYTAANNRTSGDIFMHFWNNFVPGEPDDNEFRIPRSCE